MQIDQLIIKLNWFYSLELTQVDLYTAQSKNVEDVYLKNTLKRVAVIEQQHVDNIADKIKELGYSPAVTRDIVAPFLGKIAGKIISKTGIINLLKINITLEKKAMKDYKKFIKNVSKSSKGLADVLWANLIDEDLHTAWFNSKIKQIKNKN
ncbi:MAG: ferritin-like domain-containing protein [Halanaerobiaceae bacterium]